MDSFFTRFALSNDSRSRWGRHIAFWTAAWIFQGVLYGFLNNGYIGTSFMVSFIEAFLYLPMHLFLAYSIIYFVLPRFIMKGHYWSGILLIVLLILITAMLSPLTLTTVIIPFRKLIGVPAFYRTLFHSFLGGLRGSMTVTGFAVAIKLLKQWYLKTSENERLEKEKLKAELELLKGQLHPHFMFNTLNSIYSMALKNSSQTADAILKLANLMRYMIAECNKPAISLEQELQVIRTYMDLEKSRLGERFDHAFNVHGQIGDRTIAPLLLLPFVENSFKHGAYNTTGLAWLNLDITLQQDTFTFKLVNGKGSGEHPPSSGIGLSNVRKRLSLLYPGAHDLRISEDDETYVVSLTLMLNRMVLPAA